MILLGFIGIPLLGGLLAWLAGRRNAPTARAIALAAMAGTLLLAGYAWYTGAPVVLSVPWIPAFGITFYLAMDGISLLLVLLTAAIGLVAVIVAREHDGSHPGFLYFNLLALLAGVMGVFLAQDLFLFFVFWEIMLIPAYFLLSLWGGPGRQRAAITFILFTQFGSLFLLVAIIALALLHLQQTAILTFAFPALLGTTLSPTVAMWLLAGFAIAFLVKLPVVPFHPWQPAAYAEAPTAGSILLAVLMAKTGAYALLRFAIPLFPEAAARLTPVMMTLAVISILYGAWLAFAQDDLKRLVAYSSLSHQGFMLLGIFAWNEMALQGVIMQIIAYAISTSALFIIIHSLETRLGTRSLCELGGLWPVLPRLGGLTLFFAMATLGLPGLANFLGEFLVLLGSYRTSPTFTIIAAIGLVLTLVYAMRLVQGIFFGPRLGERAVPDLHPRELTLLGVMAAILLLLGLAPQVVFNTSVPAVRGLVSTLLTDQNGIPHPQPFSQGEKGEKGDSVASTDVREEVRHDFR